MRGLVSILLIVVSCIALALACTDSNECTPISECHNAGECINSVCTNPAKDDGSPCSIGECVAGSCTPIDYQPEILVSDGNLVLQAMTDKDIEFRIGATSKKLSDIEANAITQEELDQQLNDAANQLASSISTSLDPLAIQLSDQAKDITSLEAVISEQRSAMNALSTQVSALKEISFSDSLDTVKLSIQSHGWCDGSKLVIRRNGQQINIPVATGITVAAFKPDTVELINAKQFNTHGNVGDSTAMASFIGSLDDGTIVLAGVYDEAQRSLTEQAKSALESIGSALIRSVKYREAWAIIGRKGAPRGAAVEDIGTDLTPGATPPSRCAGITFVPRPTRMLSQTFFTGPVGQQIDSELRERVYSLAEASITNLELNSRTVSVTANGYCSGNNFKVWLDGIDLGISQQRGVTLVVLDPISLDLVDSANFDTHDGTPAKNFSGKLYDYVDDIQQGSVVLAGVRDSGSNMNNMGYQALEMLGSALIRRLKFRTGWAMVGIKGAEPGTVVEDLGMDFGEVSYSDCTQGQAARPVKVLTQQFLTGEVGFTLRHAMATKADAMEVQEQFQAMRQSPDSLVISLRSAGLCAGNFVEMTVNGEAMDIPASGIDRGIKLAAFDAKDFHVLVRDTFDTYGSTDESNRLVDALAMLPQGTIVAAAAFDAMHEKLTEEAKAALENCGSHMIRDIGYRESWAMLGVKGSVRGSAVEDHGKDTGEDGNTNDNNNPCTQNQYDPRTTATLYRRYFTSDLANFVNAVGMSGVPSTFTRDRLILWLDVSAYRSGSGALWRDLSGNNNHGVLTNKGRPPQYVDAFGGYFSFQSSAVFTVNLPQISKQEDYTVTWCGLDTQGDPYAGISRGVGWSQGNHLVGWRLPAFYQGQDRASFQNYVKVGDSFCITHVNNHQDKMFHIYVDGRFFANMEYGTPNADANVLTWSIGARNLNNDHQFLGGIASVAIHAKMLSAFEIAEVSNALGQRLGIPRALASPSVPPTSGMVLWLDASRYVGSDGNIWKDLSGHGRNAQLDGLSAAPTHVETFGGYFSFAGNKAFSLDLDVIKSSSYTVFHCALETNGDAYGVVSRGTGSSSGNHRIGWQGVDIFSGNDKFRVVAGIRTGEPVCVASTNDVVLKRATVYINGAFSTEWDYSSWSDIAEWRVGQRNNGDSQYTGGLGVLLVYDRPLSATEIEALYEAFGHRYGLV